MLATIALRNIARNFRRTVLCVVAVAIAVFFTIIMQGMMDGMVDNIEEVVRVFDTGDVSIVSKEFEADAEYYPTQFPAAGGRSVEDVRAELQALPHVKAVFPRVQAYATLQDSTVKHAMLWGVDMEAEEAAHYFNLTERGNGLVEGRWPAAEGNECAIGVSLAKRAGLSIGDRIPLKTVSAEFSDKMWNPLVTGIFKFDYLKYDDEAILANFGRLQRLLNLSGSQQYFVFADAKKNSRVVTEEVCEALDITPEGGGGDVARDWQDHYFVALMRTSMWSMWLLYLVFIVVASFLIVNTVVMIIHERIKEIGMMGSLGMTRREIVEVFFFEALFLAVLGSLCGCFAGGLTTFILSFFPLDYNALSGGGFKEMPMTGTLVFKFSPVVLAQGFVFGVAVCGLCTLIPSLKSAFIEPVEALRR